MKKASKLLSNKPLQHSQTEPEIAKDALICIKWRHGLRAVRSTMSALGH